MLGSGWTQERWDMDKTYLGLLRWKWKVFTWDKGQQNYGMCSREKTVGEWPRMAYSAVSIFESQ